MNTLNQSVSVRDLIESHLKDYLENQKVVVPMLPTVASRVMQMSLNRDTNAKELSTLIQSDQGLAAHIMKIANSPMYTPNGTLVSLQQAISRLGMRMIGEIAISVSFRSKMFDAPQFEEDIANIKAHAFATALWAKEIARTCRRNVEAIFLCGLLHSIGRPAVIQKINELLKKQDLELSKDECLLLVDQFHRDLGLRIVSEWNMPERVGQVIANFDSFEGSQAGCDTTPFVITGACFADHTLKLDVNAKQKISNLETLEEINLYPDQLEELFDRNDEMEEAIKVMVQ